jgi:beta-galactosidase GanA
MAFKKPSPPYLGAAYYPEDWPLAQIDEDIKLMKQAGMKVMRVGEFAWSRMEPKEGKYDFSWLHTVVDKLGAAGIATIMGTPTATPPIWLVGKHPEVLFVGDNGREIPHGSRRHYCPHNPVYRAYTEKIVARMAEEFGTDDRILGWQIDNEVCYHQTPCVCTVCVDKFHQMLKKKYGTIEKLNHAWCTTLWSMEYQAFDQVPIPRTDVWHHPSLRTAWSEFGSDAYVDFVGFQADILHKKVTQPVGTDMMPTGQVDYFDTHQKLDVAQFNHYTPANMLWTAGFWMDFLRNVKKDVPFWNTETQTCWNGSTTANGYKEPGFCVVNSWLPVALGGEATCYWLWRQHFSGQELMHGAVVSSCGRPLHIIDEVKQIAAGFEKAGDFINNTRPVPSGLALHFSNRAQEFFRHQPMVNKFGYPWNSLLDRAYQPLLRAQFRMDVLEPAQSLDGVKVLLSPFLPVLDEGGLRSRLKKWIENGGTWIAGPMTDNRDLHASKFTHAPYGSLEEWGQFKSQFEIPGDPRDFSFAMEGGKKHKGCWWYDAMEPAGSKVIANYVDGPMKGLAAIVESKMGKGKVVVLGTMPEANAWVKLVARIAARSGIAPAAKASPNLLGVPRAGKGGEGMIVVELENKPATISIPKASVDLLTGKRYAKGSIRVKPYSVMVLKTS